MKKYLIYIGLFLFFYLLCLGNLQNLCKVYPTSGFDNQTLLLWEYTAKQAILPYRDIFYPYGYLSYYYSQNFFYAILYLSIAPLLFTCLFFSLKKLFGNNLYAVSSILFLYFFIIRITGFEIFTRYGPLLVIATLLAQYYARDKHLSKKIAIIFGLTTGIIFPFIVDIGFYAPVLFIIFSLCNYFIVAYSDKNKTITNTVNEIVYFLLGFVIALVPFVVYLYITNSFVPFLQYLNNLHEIAIYAKTPFFHSITTIDNLFVLSILLISTSYLSYIFIVKKKNGTSSNYLQLGIVITLILLEQKSIIRSINTQLTFIGFLLFLTLIADLINSLKKILQDNKIMFIYFLSLLITVVFFIGLHPVDDFVGQYPEFSKGISAMNNFSTGSCVAKNVNYLTGKYTVYRTIQRKVLAFKTFNGKIFVYPDDPIFYILFKQKPPYYPSLYEASPWYAQQTLINYIKENNITTIIDNTNIISLQDSVPDIIRGRIIQQFISENYSLNASVYGFEILIKKTTKDK